MDIDDLEFQVTYPAQNWTRGQGIELVTRNIFTCGDAKRWIAEDIVAMNAKTPTKFQEYLLKQLEKKTQEQRLFSYFTFCWGRVQWEMNISRAFENEPSEKICVFDLYLRPNASLLISMIDSVSVKSAKRYLTKWRKENPKPKRPQLTTRELYESYGNKVLLRKQYKGYNYRINVYHGHPNAYVRIPESHPLYGKDDEEINDIFIEKQLYTPHGYFTHSDGEWIGWDYAHVGDFINNGLISVDHDKRWTPEEITEEAKKVIESLKEFEE